MVKIYLFVSIQAFQSSSPPSIACFKIQSMTIMDTVSALFLDHQLSELESSQALVYRQYATSKYNIPWSARYPPNVCHEEERNRNNPSENMSFAAKKPTAKRRREGANSAFCHGTTIRLSITGQSGSLVNK